MRDKKDNATFDLPGFAPTPQADGGAVCASDSTQATAAKRPRQRRAAPKQEQLTLLDLHDTDVTGLPVWKRDPDLDLTGLPVWKPAA